MSAIYGIIEEFNVKNTKNVAENFKEYPNIDLF